ncbi:hypothetical protein V5799_007776 [Amblyomma americanum]|uniref:Uncharacterized protein n=1 Tax=Amblyomma americanum TaxID=6943 RepID=A0AAQ4FGM7_AMBAM
MSSVLPQTQYTLVCREVMDEIAEFPDVMMGMIHEREVADSFLTDFLTKRRMPKHMLLLRGETGCGKSHLLAVTVKLAIKRGFK